MESKNYKKLAFVAFVLAVLLAYYYSNFYNVRYVEFLYKFLGAG